MSTATAERISLEMFQRLVNSLCDALPPEAARAVLDIRVPPEVQELLHDYAVRHREGELREEQIKHFHSLVSTVNLLSVVKARTKASLKRREAA